VSGNFSPSPHVRNFLDRGKEDTAAGPESQAAQPFPRPWPSAHRPCGHRLTKPQRWAFLAHQIQRSVTQFRMGYVIGNAVSAALIAGRHRRRVPERISGRGETGCSSGKNNVAGQAAISSPPPHAHALTAQNQITGLLRMRQFLKPREARRRHNRHRPHRPSLQPSGRQPGQKNFFAGAGSVLATRQSGLSAEMRRNTSPMYGWFSENRRPALGLLARSKA